MTSHHFRSLAGFDVRLFVQHLICKPRAETQLSLNELRRSATILPSTISLNTVNAKPPVFIHHCSLSLPEMDDKKPNHEVDATQWKDLSSSAPELAPVSDKQAILESEKHVVLGNAPEVVEEKSFPQAIDDEGDKEVRTASSISRLSDEKIPVETSSEVKRSRKLRRALIAGGIAIVIVAIALGVGLGVGLTRKKYASYALPSSRPN